MPISNICSKYNIALPIVCMLSLDVLVTPGRVGVFSYESFGCMDVGWYVGDSMDAGPLCAAPSKLK